MFSAREREATHQWILRTAQLDAQARAERRSRRSEAIGMAFMLGEQSLSFFSPDILQHLAGFLEIDDLACLARTCRKLHNTLVRELLKRPVDLWPQDLESFLAFLVHLSQNPTTTFPTFWSLSIDFQYVERHRCDTSDGRCVYECRFRLGALDGMWELLGEIMQYAHGLSGLALKGCVDRVLSGEELRSVLDLAPGLRSLTLGEIRQEHLNALQDVVPDLRTLSFKYHTTLRIPGAAHAPALLDHFQKLEELDVHWFFWQQQGVQLPNLKKLKVKMVYLGTNMSSWAGALVRTFPNLTHLDFWEMYSVDPGRDVADRYTNEDGTKFVRMLEQWHAEGEALRREDRRLPLQYVRVRSLLNLHCLGLSCAQPGARVYVGTVGVDDTKTIARCLPPLLPKCVGFCLDTNVKKQLYPICRQLFSSAPEMTSLTHVVMNVPTMYLFPWNLPDIAAALAHALKESSVSHVLVRVQDTPSTMEECGRPESGDLYRVLDRHMDRAYASAPVLLATFRDNVPSARRVFFELEGFGLTCWERSGERWVDLGEAEGRRILVAEKMLGGEMDEVPYPGLPVWDRFEWSPEMK
ncbi:hypothetical protein OH77DRAFT_1435412 [Trametes cingulata]|nr:hypothetical protein OH77DRAFT_1435412 [Trametes cingulata]